MSSNNGPYTMPPYTAMACDCRENTIDNQTWTNDRPAHLLSNQILVSLPGRDLISPTDITAQVPSDDQ
uniref:Uncharacterized protein n=1 Tax=Anguilla anguilla TaxID=7936 RepID=A0A0E9P5N4_ANGAN